MVKRQEAKEKGTVLKAAKAKEEAARQAWETEAAKRAEQSPAAKRKATENPESSGSSVRLEAKGTQGRGRSQFHRD